MNININNNFDENLYNELLLTENILIPPEKFNSKINVFIEESLKKKIENKCICEGYVKSNSINIVKKSIGNLKGSQFNGYINYEILFKALVCSPKNGSIIKCKVKLINNKLGILGNNGPLTIIVGKQLHNNPELLDEINIDDIVEVKVIEIKYSLDDKEIRILGKLNIDKEVKNKKNIDSLDEDLDEIDADNINDIESITKNDIDDISLESLDNLSSDDEDEIDDDMDNDEIDDDMDDDGNEDDEMMDSEMVQEEDEIEEVREDNEDEMDDEDNIDDDDYS